MFLEEVLCISTQLAEAFGGPALLEPPAFTSTRGINPGSTMHRKPRGALQLDIERIFARKLQIFGGVDFNRETMLSAILKSSFK